MTVRANTLHPKPEFTPHRDEPQGDRALVIDSTDLQKLYEGDPGAGPPDITAKAQAALNCRRWKSVKVYVLLTGGAVPTVDLVPLEVVSGEGAFPGATDEDRGFAVSAAATGALSSGDMATVVIDGGLLFLRVSAITGAPTGLKVYVAGEEIVPSLTGQE